MQAAPLTVEVVGGKQGVERVKSVGNSSSDELKIDLILFHNVKAVLKPLHPVDVTTRSARFPCLRNHFPLLT